MHASYQWGTVTAYLSGVMSLSYLSLELYFNLCCHNPCHVSEQPPTWLRSSSCSFVLRSVLSLLKDETSELFMSERKYYNLIGHQRPEKSKDKTTNGLLKAMHEEGFNHRLRLDFDEQGKGPNQQIVNRRLAQIFF